MIVGSGVDFEEPDRVRAAIERHGDFSGEYTRPKRFLRRATKEPL